MLVFGLYKEVLCSAPSDPFFFLLNIMRRNSPAFFEKKKKFKPVMLLSSILKILCLKNVVQNEDLSF
jgi:hypothetical protein